MLQIILYVRKKYTNPSLDLLVPSSPVSPHIPPRILTTSGGLVNLTHPSLESPHRTRSYPFAPPTSASIHPTRLDSPLFARIAPTRAHTASVSLSTPSEPPAAFIPFSTRSIVSSPPDGALTTLPTAQFKYACRPNSQAFAPCGGTISGLGRCGSSGDMLVCRARSA